MSKKYLGFTYWPRYTGKGFIAHLTHANYPTENMTFADSENEIDREIKLFTHLFINKKHD